MKLTISQLAEIQTRAVSDVWDERLRQVQDLGYTSGHDDAYLGQQLARAAAAYAIAGFNRVIAFRFYPANWTNSGLMVDRRTQLVRAGALILAEIERLDRNALREQESAE